MNTELTMSFPDIDEQDVEAVARVLRSGHLALGPKAVEFERAIADYVGVGSAVAVSSGTAALHLIVKAMGLGRDDEVLVPSFTFAASVNALLYERVTPIFVEIEDKTYNLDPSDLEARITTRTRAIMAVDVFGHPAEWDEILKIADKYGLRVIDDCCEALGAEYRGRRLGGLGNAGAFAFYPNKQITTGEGGIITTSDEKLARLCRSLRNQGRAEMGAWLEHQSLGFNYRMDELSAALGVSQMRRVEDFLSRRDQVARCYTRKLSGFDWIRTPIVLPHVRMSWFVYVVTLAKGLSRAAFVQEMEAQGIPVRGYFSPIHLQPYVRELIRAVDLPITESVAARTLALPFHNSLTEEQIDTVVSGLEAAASKVV